MVGLKKVDYEIQMMIIHQSWFRYDNFRSYKSSYLMGIKFQLDNYEIPN
jgi:hypothetical protein